MPDGIHASGRAAPRIPHVISVFNKGETSCNAETLHGGGRDRGDAAIRSPDQNAWGSSHREAPNITRFPTVDSTDFYLFNSYEPGRDGYVTLLANYIPLQEPYGGPNYFAMDPSALYEIHVDNDGDAKENLTFQFRFTNRLANDNRGIKLNIGGSAGRGAAQECRRRQRGRQQRAEFPRELPDVAGTR